MFDRPSEEDLGVRPPVAERTVMELAEYWLASYEPRDSEIRCECARVPTLVAKLAAA